MSDLANSLNLRPQEKRIIAVIAFLVFVVLNLFLVFPQFKQYRIIEGQLKSTLLAIQTNQAYIDLDNRAGGLKDQLDRLENEKGGPVSSKEVQLQQTITDEARSSSVFIQTISAPISTPIGSGSLSDKFFETQSIRIVVQAGEESLVKFLYNIGNDPAMIRVRELTMNPVDANRYKLNANITLTADYEKTVVPKKAAPILTDASLKTPAKAPAAAPAPPAARSASTNGAPAQAAPGRAIVPPVPPTPGQPNLPLRTPRT
jgi:hypothetical protein